jgi:hypothetical protein
MRCVGDTYRACSCCISWAPSALPVRRDQFPLDRLKLQRRSGMQVRPETSSLRGMTLQLDHIRSRHRLAGMGFSIARRRPASQRPIGLYSNFLIGNAPALAVFIEKNDPEQVGFRAVVDDEMGPAIAFAGFHRKRRIELRDHGEPTPAVGASLPLPRTGGPSPSAQLHILHFRQPAQEVGRYPLPIKIPESGRPSMRWPPNWPRPRGWSAGWHLEVSSLTDPNRSSPPIIT